MEVVGQLEACPSATSPAAARFGRRLRRSGSDRDRCDSSSRGRRACPGRAAHSGSPGHCAGLPPIRAGMPSAQQRILQGRDLHQDRLGQIAQGVRRLDDGRPCRGCRARRCAAVPCPGSCAGSDRDRRHCGTGRPAPDTAPRRGRVEHQAVEQLVDHAGVVDEDFRQELAPGAQLDVELQARRVEAEQLPQDRLAAERRGDLFEIDEGHVGVGRLGDGAQKLRARCWPGTAGSGATTGTGSSRSRAG